MMKTTIDVNNRQEADQIKRGLTDPTVRAFVVVMGALMTLPTERARKRVLQYVIDKFDEEKSP